MVKLFDSANGTIEYKQMWSVCINVHFDITYICTNAIKSVHFSNN